MLKAFSADKKTELNKEPNPGDLFTVQHNNGTLETRQFAVGNVTTVDGNVVIEKNMNDPAIAFFAK